ncbi:hypothetical protein PFISCL1PPCAC_1688, partial [Pristionchus fissidentatus]
IRVNCDAEKSVIGIGAFLGDVIGEAYGNRLPDCQNTVSEQNIDGSILSEITEAKTIAFSVSAFVLLLHGRLKTSIMAGVISMLGVMGYNLILSYITSDTLSSR